MTFKCKRNSLCFDTTNQNIAGESQLEFDNLAFRKIVFEKAKFSGF